MTDPKVYEGPDRTGRYLGMAWITNDPREWQYWLAEDLDGVLYRFDSREAAVAWLQLRIARKGKDQWPIA